jgi:hypothetical protein
MVRKKKITSQTDNSNWKAPKKRKKRKPMSEEQRVAAAERLAKAREKKKSENPDYGMSGIHSSLRDLPDDSPLSVKKVKQWIKTQKGIMSSERASERQGVKGARSKWKNAEAYIRDMNTYLRNGDWVSMFYGEYEQHKVKYRVRAMAYDKDGNPKRDVGKWYPDIGTYTQEMFDEDKELKNGRTRKTNSSDNKRPLEKNKQSKNSRRRRTKTT